MTDYITVANIKEEHNQLLCHVDINDYPEDMDELIGRAWISNNSHVSMSVLEARLAGNTYTETINKAKVLTFILPMGYGIRDFDDIKLSFYFRKSDEQRVVSDTWNYLRAVPKEFYYDATTPEEEDWFAYVDNTDDTYMRKLEVACWNLFHYQIEKSTEVGPHGWELGGATSFWKAANKNGLALPAGGYTDWKHYSGRGYDSSISLAKTISKEGHLWGEDLLEVMKDLRDSGSKSSYNPTISNKRPDVRIYHTDANPHILHVDINYPYAKALWDTYTLNLYKYIAVGTPNYWDEIRKGKVISVPCEPTTTVELDGYGVSNEAHLVAYLMWKNGRHKWGTPSGGSKAHYPWGKPGEAPVVEAPEVVVEEETVESPEVVEITNDETETLLRTAKADAIAAGYKGTNWHRALVTLGYEKDPKVFPWTLQEVEAKVALWEDRKNRGNPLATEKLRLWEALRDGIIG